MVYVSRWTGTQKQVPGILISTVLMRLPSSAAGPFSIHLSSAKYIQAITADLFY